MKKQVLAAACGLFFAIGMANAQVVVHVGPPPPVHEVVPPSPHPGWVWQQGYHRWDGNAYVWTAGTWAEPPHAGAAWVPGHWAHRGGGWVWVDGHWR